MNKLKIFFTPLMLVFFLHLQANAQSATDNEDTVIKNQTIRITQIYKPQIRQPLKPNLMPNLPTPDTSKLQFQYTVPEQTLVYSYHSQPIRPLALGGQDYVIPYKNYIKAGAGNLTSIYLDAGIGGLSMDKFQTAFHISHLSQKGKAEDQQSGNTAFDGDVKYYLGQNHILNASLQARNRRFRYYGFDHSLIQYTKEELQQSITDGGISLGIDNMLQNNSRLKYQPEFHIGMMGEHFGTHETRIGFELPAQYSFEQISAGNFFNEVSGQLSLELIGDFLFIGKNHVTYNNNLLKILPAADFSYKKTDLHLGLTPTFGDDNFYLLPDLKIQTKVLNDRLILNAGIKSDVNIYSSLNLSLYNPFINLFFKPEHTLQHQYFAGATTSIDKFISVGLTAAYKEWNNLPIFQNDYLLNVDGKTFNVIHNGFTQALGLDFFARYQPSELFGASINGSWNSYYNKFQIYETSLGYPDFELTALLETRPIKDLHAHIGFTLLEGIYYFNPLLGDNPYGKQGTIFDLNLGAEYNIISRLSVFLQLNNITNQKYQRWNQYAVYGFNVIGGIRFKF